MMINNAEELDRAIEALEHTRKSQEKELVEQFHATKESLRPGNLIKSSLGKLGSSDVIGPVLKTAGSLGITLLTSKLMGGAPAVSGTKNILGSVLKQSAVKSVVKNFDTIKAYGLSIFQNVFGDKKKG
ncbi:MAG: hypothetical protein QM687_01595 [Ferruginibacter sp.]